MVPVECRPLLRYKHVRPCSLLVQIILSMNWYNWSSESIRQIKREISLLNDIEYAPAKTGYWFRYKVPFNNTKIQVEFFVRVMNFDN